MLMTTNLKNTRESARLLRTEVANGVTQTNVQKALEAIITAAIPSEPTQVTTSTATIAPTASAVVIARVSPTATGLMLPAVVGRNHAYLSIFDLSTSLSADHVITLTPNGSETIMGLSSWQIISTSAQLAGITLRPSTTINGWYIAP